jgi:UDP-GlcNAc3NAcA epimerase
MTSCDVVLCYETRPQVIEASVLRTELARHCAVVAIDTGLQLEYTLQAFNYEQLAVVPPDLFLEVGPGTATEQTAGVMLRTDAVLKERQPRAVVVMGDTHSTLGAALAAARLRIPVVHVQAGLRARDATLPEEVNRRAVDAIARVLCTPSETATRRVRAERPDAIVVETGDIAFDAVLGQSGHLPDAAKLLPAGCQPPYVLAILHRAELTQDPAVLLGVVAALGRLGQHVLLPVHPRTRQILESASNRLPPTSMVHLVPSPGYRDSLALIRGAALVVTDAGGVERKSYWLGVPGVTLRDETEWEEVIACGASRLHRPGAADRLPAAISEQLARWSSGERWANDAYGTGRAARAVAAATTGLLAGTAFSMA